MRWWISDFEDGEFYGFCNDSEQKVQEDLRKEMEDKEYVIDTYGEETEEYKEAKMDLQEKKNELNRQIELSCGFGELRSLGDFEEAKKWKTIEEIDRQEEAGDQLPTIQEANVNDLGRRFRERRRALGVRVQTRPNRKQMAKIRGTLSQEGMG